MDPCCNPDCRFDTGHPGDCQPGPELRCQSCGEPLDEDATRYARKNPIDGSVCGCCWLDMMLGRQAAE
jgi:hypothetical protein